MARPQGAISLQSLRRSCKWLAPLLLLSCLLGSDARGEGMGVSEEIFKSAFLFKFTHFTEWPVGRIGGQGATNPET